MPSERSQRAAPLRFIAVLVLGAVLAAGSARAQTPSPLGEWQYSAGVVLKKRFDLNPPHWEELVGFGVETLPRFEGSDDYYLEPGPTIDVRYRDLAFFSTGEGLGVNLLHNVNYRAGIALTYDLGRSEGDAYRLGQHNLSPAIAPKLFAEYVFFPVVVRGDVRHNLGGVGGWIGDLSAYLPVMGNQHFFVFVGGTVTIADRTYLDHDFGVSVSQAKANDLPVYTPGGGIKSAGFGSNMTYIFDKHWFLDGVFAANRLIGPAASSPDTVTKLQYAASVSLAYDFR